MGSGIETGSGFEGVSLLRRLSSLEGLSMVEFGGFLLSSPFSISESGLWVTGSMPLCLSFFFKQEFHRFFISLSVLPGNCAAI